MPGVRSTLLGRGSAVPLLISARGTCKQRVTWRCRSTRVIVHVSTVPIVVVVVVDTEPGGRVTRVVVTTCPITCVGSRVPGEHQHAAITALH